MEKDHYDRAILVTVPGEILEQEAAQKEIYTALQPGGILVVTEVIFDRHFQSRETRSSWQAKPGSARRVSLGNARLTPCTWNHLSHNRVLRWNTEVTNVLPTTP